MSDQAVNISGVHSSGQMPNAIKLQRDSDDWCLDESLRAGPVDIHDLPRLGFMTESYCGYNELPASCRGHKRLLRVRRQCDTPSSFALYDLVWEPSDAQPSLSLSLCITPDSERRLRAPSSVDNPDSPKTAVTEYVNVEEDESSYLVRIHTRPHNTKARLFSRGTDSRSKRGSNDLHDHTLSFKVAQTDCQAMLKLLDVVRDWEKDALNDRVLTKADKDWNDLCHGTKELTISRVAWELPERRKRKRECQHDAEEAATTNPSIGQADDHSGNNAVVPSVLQAPAAVISHHKQLPERKEPKTNWLSVRHMERHHYMHANKTAVKRMTATLEGKLGSFHAVRPSLSPKTPGYYVVEWWSSNVMEKSFIFSGSSKSEDIVRETASANADFVTANVTWCKTSNGSNTIRIKNVLAHCGKDDLKTGHAHETLELNVVKSEHQKMMDVLAVLSDYEKHCQDKSFAGC